MRSLYSLFLSHAWGTDSHGRSNHERVAQLRRRLSALGYNVWIDEDHLMLGDSIDDAMSDGIMSSDAICMCITRRYIEKINHARINNCKKEWNLSVQTGKRIIPLIMEREMLDPGNWPLGTWSMYMQNTFYMDGTSDDVNGVAQRLARLLRILGVPKRPAPPRLALPVPASPTASSTRSTRSTRLFRRGAPVTARGLHHIVRV